MLAHERQRPSAWVDQGLEAYLTCPVVSLEEEIDSFVFVTGNSNRGWVRLERKCGEETSRLVMASPRKAHLYASFPSQEGAHIARQELETRLASHILPGYASDAIKFGRRGDRTALLEWAGRVLGVAVFGSDPATDTTLVPGEQICVTEASKLLFGTELAVEALNLYTGGDRVSVSGVDVFGVYRDTYSGILGSRHSALSGQKISLFRGTLPVTNSTVTVGEGCTVAGLSDRCSSEATSEDRESAVEFLRSMTTTEFVHWMAIYMLGDTRVLVVELCQHSQPTLELPRAWQFLNSEGRREARSLALDGGDGRYLEAQAMVYHLDPVRLGEDYGLSVCKSYLEPRVEGDSPDYRRVFATHDTIMCTTRHRLTEGRHILAMLLSLREASAPVEEVALPLSGAFWCHRGTVYRRHTPWITLLVFAASDVCGILAIALLSSSYTNICETAGVLSGAVTAVLFVTGVVHRCWYADWLPLDGLARRRVVNERTHLSREEELEVLHLSLQDGSAAGLYRRSGSCYITDAHGKRNGLGPLDGPTLVRLGYTFGVSPAGHFLLKDPRGSFLRLTGSGACNHAEVSKRDTMCLSVAPPLGPLGRTGDVQM